MHYHLEECDGGDSDRFEVVWVFGPRALSAKSFVCLFIVFVERVSVGVYESDGIFEFCGYGVRVL